MLHLMADDRLRTAAKPIGKRTPAMTSYVDRQEKAKFGIDRDAEMRLKNNRLGMTIFQASWIMVFFALIVVNWQLRFSYAQWPPEGVAPFDPLLPSAATLALLLSALLARQGWCGLRPGKLQSSYDWRLTMRWASSSWDYL